MELALAAHIVRWQHQAHAINLVVELVAMVAKSSASMKKVDADLHLRKSAETKQAAHPRAEEIDSAGLPVSTIASGM